jgi:lipopolysaccharide heptosyltransferase II
MGDIVLALPALTALRKSFVDAKISWLARSEYTPLLEGHPHLDQVILFDRIFLGKACYHPKALGALVSFVLRLNKSRFDVVFDFQGLFRTAAFAWLSGCRRRFGPAKTRELAGLFYTDKIPQGQDHIHLVDYYLEMTRSAGAINLPAEFVLPDDPAAKTAVSKLLAHHGLEPGNYVVFVPSSAHFDKRWPTERFAELAGRITERFDLPVAAVGSSNDSTLVDELKTLAHVRIADLTGRTSLKELISLLGTARLVVSNDTGAGHIAAALGRPVVMIFGRSNPARVAPYGQADSVVAVDLDGRGFAADSTDPRHDIRAITVEQVFQTVCRRLHA